MARACLGWCCRGMEHVGVLRDASRQAGGWYWGMEGPPLTDTTLSVEMAPILRNYWTRVARARAGRLGDQGEVKAADHGRTEDGDATREKRGGNRVMAGVSGFYEEQVFASGSCDGQPHRDDDQGPFPQFWACPSPGTGNRTSQNRLDRASLEDVVTAARCD